MGKDLLLGVINSVSDFTETEAAFFVSLFEEKKYRRNSVLLKEGEISHEVFFVTEGALRQCFDNEQGDEHTCNISFEGEFLTDLESFSRQSRSATRIVALEHTTCLVTTCVKVASALNESPAIAKFFRNIVERVAEEGIRRTKSMLSLTPERRFEELISTKPQIVARVSQRYIAQYLGIAPESLSRIRKRLMEQVKS